MIFTTYFKFYVSFIWGIYYNALFLKKKTFLCIYR